MSFNIEFKKLAVYNYLEARKLSYRKLTARDYCINNYPEISIRTFQDWVKIYKSIVSSTDYKLPSDSIATSISNDKINIIGKKRYRDNPLNKYASDILLDVIKEGITSNKTSLEVLVIQRKVMQCVQKSIYAPLLKTKTTFNCSYRFISDIIKKARSNGYFQNETITVTGSKRRILIHPVEYYNNQEFEESISESNFAVNQDNDDGFSLGRLSKDLTEPSTGHILSQLLDTSHVTNKSKPISAKHLGMFHLGNIVSNIHEYESLDSFWKICNKSVDESRRRFMLLKLNTFYSLKYLYDRSFKNILNNYCCFGFKSELQIDGDLINGFIIETIKEKERNRIELRCSLNFDNYVYKIDINHYDKFFSHPPHYQSQNILYNNNNTCNNYNYDKNKNNNRDNELSNDNFIFRFEGKLKVILKLKLFRDYSIDNNSMMVDKNEIMFICLGCIKLPCYEFKNLYGKRYFISDMIQSLSDLLKIKNINHCSLHERNVKLAN